MLSKIQGTSINQQYRAKTVNATPQYLAKASADSVSFGRRLIGPHAKEFQNLYKRSNDLFTVLEQKYSTTEKLEKNGIEIGTVVTKFIPKVKMELPNGNIVELYRNPKSQLPALEVVDKNHTAPSIRYDINQKGTTYKQEMVSSKSLIKMENKEESLAVQSYFQQVLNKFGM